MTVDEHAGSVTGNGAAGPAPAGTLGACNGAEHAQATVAIAARRRGPEPNPFGSSRCGPHAANAASDTGRWEP